MELNEPQIISSQGFLNEDGTEMTSIQIHPDSTSIDLHKNVLRENRDEAFSETCQIVHRNIGIAYYGTPPASILVLDMMSEGVTHLNLLHLAVFTRTEAG